MFILGVDAGGSKTRAAVIDEAGQKWADAVAGPGSHERVGMAAAMTAIGDAVRAALRQAKIDPGEVAVACYALAGLDWPEDEELLRAALAEQIVVGGRQVLVHDAVAALRGGTAAGWGVAVVFGTGSSAAARDPQGRQLILGNLGYAFGDHCGAQAMVQEAFRAIFRAADLRAPGTRLTNLFLAQLGLDDAAELRTVLHCGGIAYEQQIQLVHAVLEAARCGDAAATSILSTNLDELSALATAAARQLSLTRETTPIVLAGGLWQALTLAERRSFYQAVKQVVPLASFAAPSLPPVLGAAVLGLEALRGPIEDEAWHRLQREGGSSVGWRGPPGGERRLTERGFRQSEGGETP